MRRYITTSVQDVNRLIEIMDQWDSYFVSLGYPVLLDLRKEYRVIKKDLQEIITKELEDNV